MNNALIDPSLAPRLELGVWCPPPAGDSSEETERRYVELSAAGFNMAWNIPPEALDACAAAGVRGLVHLPATRDEQDNTETCLAFMRPLKDHPALAGFNIMDEPSCAWFKKIAAIRRAVEAELEGGRYALCNLYPDYADTKQLSGRPPEGVTDIAGWEADNHVDYTQHVDRYMAEIRPRFLSYDYYPLYAEHTDDSGFMKNMRVIADAAKRYGVSFHGFLQAISWNGHRKPTIGEYRWLAHGHFVHGAASLSYFYYRAPYRDGGPEGFTSALVDYEGNKTELYDNACIVNAELRAMSGAFLQFTHRTFMAVNFTPDELLFMGMHDAVPSFGGVSLSSGEQVIAGCFEKNGADGFYVMNYAHDAPAQARLDLGGVKQYELWNGSGLSAQGEAETLEIPLAPGAAVFVAVGN